jgi:putative hydrolase of the HAD superfamily
VNTAGAAAPVRAVLWDADGVLQRFPAGEESIRPSIVGLVRDEDAFVAAARDAEWPALTGDARWLDDVLPGFLAEWGIADAYDNVVRDWFSIEAVPGTRDIVDALREAGVPCYLATNQAMERGTFMHEDLGYGQLLDGAFYSYELGVAKPDPAYFTTILDRLDVPAGQVLFVDDRLDNVESARSLGLRAEVWSYVDGLDVLRGHLKEHDLPDGPG